VFKRTFGEPKAVVVTGASLGGIVTVQAIEQANIGNVIGGLTVCGAIAGSRNRDGALDARLLYDTVCGQVPGAFIPGGAYGLPKNSTFTQADLGAAINACFGLLQPGGPSLAQAQRLGLFLGVTKLPVGFVGTVMGFATFGLADLVYDPGKLSGQLGTGNVGVDYGEPFVNNAIARVAPTPVRARSCWPTTRRLATPGAPGSCRCTPTRTAWSSWRTSASTPSARPPTGSRRPSYAKTRQRIAGSTAPSCWPRGSRCARGWRGAPQPTPATIQGTCSAIAAGGLAPGPCRIDPTFVIPDMDGRVRPRQ
jgi:hypothetical protein